jgi:hypothetical protein
MDGGELLDEGGTVDAVEAAGVIGQGELLLARPPWPAARRRPRGEAKMGQDLLGDVSVLDDRDQVHRAGAPSAHQNVKTPRSLHQHRPREPALACCVVWAYQAVTAPSKQRWNADLAGWEDIVSRRDDSGVTELEHTYGAPNGPAAYSFLVDARGYLALRLLGRSTTGVGQGGDVVAVVGLTW